MDEMNSWPEFDFLDGLGFTEGESACDKSIGRSYKVLHGASFDLRFSYDRGDRSVEIGISGREFFGLEFALALVSESPPVGGLDVASLAELLRRMWPDLSELTKSPDWTERVRLVEEQESQKWQANCNYAEALKKFLES